jgi:hypothetical protein
LGGLERPWEALGEAMGGLVGALLDLAGLAGLRGGPEGPEGLRRR